MSLIEGKEYQEQAVNGTDICGPDEYIDADGLRVCAICHKPRQIRRTVLGREIIPSVPCRCQEEERSRNNEGQAGKGAGRMPWHQEPKKDVISCEKPRGAANEQ